jgi:hypothetical protein
MLFLNKDREFVRNENVKGGEGYALYKTILPAEFMGARGACSVSAVSRKTVK